MSTTIRTTEMSTINCKPFKEASLSIIADGSTSAGEELQETEECISLSSDSSDEESRVAETVEEIQEAENSDDSEEPQEIHSRSERPPLSIPKSHMIAASSNPRRTALLSPYILQNQLGSRFPYHSIHGIHQRQNLNCTPYYYHGPARCGMNSPYLQPPNNFLSSSLSSSSSTSSQQKDSADAGIQPVSSFFKKTCYKC
ncbi:hypothetical protein PACTADRAFT_35108 [Pachysolen tannophilus NRRL Y-2460]|uniref:Uncharacterized protein n=1 Tax=Pachysolen tannophilus NRRL Y-2460 TaxID=669874 RepID=A0A1E4TRB1_PACTA|nr:hypothetical protein PACTADRAFT_35108 [Pachysolen tannophilus NRRL Y-2460]